MLSTTRSFTADQTGNNLLDSIRILQQTSMATSGHLPEQRGLVIRLSNIVTGMCRYVSAIDFLGNDTPRSKERVATYSHRVSEDVIEQRLTPLGRLFPSLLDHLHALSEYSGSGSPCGQIVYDFIQVFRVLFQRICDLAEADARSSQERFRTTKQPNTRQNQQCATSFSDMKPVTSPIIMKLCKLAISMFFHLDPAKSTHRAILEGCLFLLVTRVGEVLQDFTIGERPFGIQEVDATSRHNSHPRERRRVKSPNAANDTKASEAQAPYIIWMLSRTMRLSTSTSMSFVNKSITSSDQRSEAAQQDFPRSALYEDSHIRLQHTLVRAVFGDKFAANFEPALKPPPTASGDDLWTDLNTQIETVDVRDWFKNEVWRLVGWDVLRGNITWN